MVVSLSLTRDPLPQWVLRPGGATACGRSNSLQPDPRRSLRLLSSPTARVFLVTDKQGESACMTVYNMAPDQLTQGDVLQMDRQTFDYQDVAVMLGDKEVAFRSLRISDPARLRRNGKPLGRWAARLPWAGRLPWVGRLRWAPRYPRPHEFQPCCAYALSPPRRGKPPHACVSH